MKKENNLKIIIALLSIIILLLVGFIIFFIYEFIDERDEIRELYNSSDRINTENNETVIRSGNDNNIINNSSDNNSSIISNNNDSKNYISKEKALNVALDDTNLNQNDIHDIEVELDYKYNETVYEVTFNYQQYEYEYYINAETGNILKSFKEID